MCATVLNRLIVALLVVGFVFGPLGGGVRLAAAKVGLSRPCASCGMGSQPARKAPLCRLPVCPPAAVVATVSVPPESLSLSPAAYPVGRAWWPAGSTPVFDPPPPRSLLVR